MHIEQIRIPAMQSHRDAERIRTALERLDGVVRVHIALPQHAVRIDHDGRASLKQFITAVQRAGYREVAAMA
jgi:copper chaperone CopZ